MSEQQRPEATEAADTYQRHESDPSKWEEAPAVTDRPNDTPLRGEDTYAVPNTTLAERARAAEKASAKQVDEAAAEDKAVGSSESKSRSRRAKK